MIQRTILCLCVFGFLSSCISVQNSPEEAIPENVIIFDAFRENNLKFLSPIVKAAMKQTEILLYAPEGLTLTFNMKNRNTGKNVNTVFSEKAGSRWKVGILFPEKGDYEFNILIEKGKDFHNGAARIAYTANLPEDLKLITFLTDNRNTLVWIKDTKVITEDWSPGKMKFYSFSYSKYMTGLLENDAVFVFNNQTFSLPADTGIRFNSGDGYSRCLAFVPANDYEMIFGDYRIQYEQGTLIYADAGIIVGYSAKECTLSFMGAALNCPMESAIAFGKNGLMGVQLSKDTEIVIRSFAYPCANYLYLDDYNKNFTIILARDTSIISGNTKLICPARSSVAFSEKAVADIYLSGDTIITVDGKNQTIQAGYLIYFDEHGNFREAVQGK